MSTDRNSPVVTEIAPCEPTENPLKLRKDKM